MSGLQTWLRHFLALLRKNAAVASVRWGTFLAIVVIPLALTAVLPIIDEAIDASTSSSSTSSSGPVSRAVPLERCVSLDQYGEPSSAAPPCTTLLYAPTGSPYDEVVADALLGAGMTAETDAEGFADETSMLAAIGDRVGGVLFAVSFQDNGTAAASGLFDTRIYYNSSSGNSFSAGGGLSGMQPVAMQGALGGAVARHLAAPASPSGRLSLRYLAIPAAVPRTDPEDAEESSNLHSDSVRYGGNVAITLGAAVSALMASHLVSGEKRAKLLGAMRVLGLHEGAYWCSWMATFAAVAVPVAALLPLLGVATGLRVFERASFGAHFLALLLYCSSSFSQSMVVSAIASRARNVNVAGFALIFYTVILAPSMADGNGNFIASRDTSTIVLIVTYPFPFVWYSWVFGVMMDGTAAPGASFSFGDLEDNVPGAGRPASFGLWIMLAWTLGYTLVAWYLSQVFSDQLGASRPPWFPLTPEFWGFASPPQVVEGDTVEAERALSLRDSSIRTLKLSKTYKGTAALKEVTLQLRPHDITAVLGANGAGKSTLINCMSCLTTPTFGKVFVRGLDVSRSQQEIQASMGVCHQADLLWPELTSREHLQLFGALRGVDPAQLPAMIASKLEDFDLGGMIDSRVGSMSGGMKRRLSISVATISDPAVVFLDEPSSGLDPLTRFHLWKSIRLLKRTSLVVLTTHSMEEADELGDSIAILSNGRLRACGTSLFLKERFGSGYQLQLNVAAARVPRIQQLAALHMPGADVVSAAAGSVTLGMPRSALPGVPRFFEALEDDGQLLPQGEEERQAAERQQNGDAGSAATSGVTDWSFSNSTLEEVFLRLAGTDVEVNAAAGGSAGAAALDVCAVCHERPPGTVTLFTRRGHGVRISGFVCPVCARDPDAADAAEEMDPEMAAALEAAMKEEAAGGGGEDGADDVQHVNERRIAAENDDDEEEASAPLMADRPAAAGEEAAAADRGARIQSYVSTGLKPSAWAQARAIFLKNVSLIRSSSRKSTVIKGVLSLIGTLVVRYGGADSNGSVVLPYEDTAYEDVAAGRGATRAWRDQCWYSPSSTAVFSCGQGPDVAPAPWLGASLAVEGDPSDFAQLDPFGLGAGELSARRVDPERFDREFEAGDELYTVELAAAASSAAEEAAAGQLELAENATAASPNRTDARERLSAALPPATLVVDSADVAEGGLSAEIGVWLSEFQGDYAEESVGVLVEDSPGSDFRVSALEREFGQAPGEYTAFVVDALVRGVRPGAGVRSEFAALPEVFARTPEYTEIVDGLNWLTIVSMLHFPAVAARVVAEREGGLVAAMRVSGLRTVTYWLSNALFDYVFIMVWNLLLVALLYIFQTASIVAVPGEWTVTLALVWPVAQLGMGYGIAAAVSTTSAASVISYVTVIVSVGLAALGGLLKPGTFKDWLTVFVPVGHGRAVGSLLRYRDAGPEDVRRMWGLTTAVGLAYLAVAVAVNVARLYSAGLYASLMERGAVHHVDREAARAAGEGADTGDAAVEEERRLVRDDFESLAAAGGIVARGAHKAYPLGGGAYKHALNDLSVRVAPGSVTALLGPNGCGKTTWLKAVTGSHRLSRGEIRVAGFDVERELAEVHTRIGYVPQFDALFGDLTVRQHLLFYSRLKGVPASRERALVQFLAEEVVLDGDALDKKASTLSGGQRRRLSLGVALCGNVEILVVDEPSTGLDPTARRDLWRILQRQGRRGRAVLVTTHSMEEAEVLADRIAIMNQGRLIVLGPQAALKKKWGDGFHLTLGLEGAPDDAAVARLGRYVRGALCARARPGPISGTSVVFTLPADAHKDVLALFDKMERGREAMRERLGVIEWGVAMASLEGVFVASVTNDQKRRQRAGAGAPPSASPTVVPADDIEMGHVSPPRGTSGGGGADGGAAKF